MKFSTTTKNDLKQISIFPVIIPVNRYLSRKKEKKRILATPKFPKIFNFDTNFVSPSKLPEWRAGVVSPSLLAASSALNPIIKKNI